MQIQEMATEILKSAIENKVIRFDPFSYDDNGKIEEQNKFNVKQISDCYKTIVKTIASTLN